MCKKLLMFVFVFGLVTTAFGQPTGEILFEYWLDIGGTAISDLTGQATYPDNPSDGEMRTSFDGPLDWRDNYGERARGWLYPPEDGEYTFWIAGDDFMNLLLSTDDDPANATLIAEVPGWTSYQQWDAYPEQQSAPITLAAGGKYYIEALGKEGGGGDSLTVGWTGPGIGDTITVIDGAYLSPADWSPSLLKARNPEPADGAVDVDAGILKWDSGKGDVASHQVYLNDELLIETEENVAAAAIAPGTVYTWRVDEIQGDGSVIGGNTWSFTTLPLEAHFPSPADGAVDVKSPATLRWTPGKNAILNIAYFGTDQALVEARDVSTRVLANSPFTTVNVGELALFTTYYWAVDEFTPAGTVPGPTWSFSSEGYVPILLGSQSLNYHNHGEPYVSELAIDAPADITAGGKVSNLVLNFKGAAPILEEKDGTYTISGEGADIWGNSDQFHYVYMQLTGDGEISARVVSNGTGSNTWAKGGVMIRESTAPDSRHMIMGMTGGDGGGIAFQGRFAATAAASSGLHGDITASPPHWVKIVRTGNEISGYHSADGQAWDLFTDASPDNSGGNITNPQPIDGLPDTVLIGLFVTSHADGENRTYVFDNVDIQGNVDGVIVSADIDSVTMGNDADPIYVALEDAAGAVAVINHPDPAATRLTTTQTWIVPIAAFGGVDLAAVSKLIVGVGNGEPGGEGDITVSNVKVVDNDEVDIDVVVVSDMYDDSGDGAADDIGWVKLLLDAGYVVDYTKGAGLGDGYWRTLDDEKIAALNAANLVIVSRNTDSGSYDDGDEIAQWNAVTSPLILSSTHIARNSRWKFFDSTTILNLAPVMELADGTAVVAIDDTHGQSSFMDAAAGNGTVLATGDGLPWIVQWAAGAEYYDGAGQTAGGPRVFFTGGAQEVAGSIGRGEMNLTAEGQAIFLNICADLMNPNLIPNGDLEDGTTSGWGTYGDASLEISHDALEGEHCLHVTVNSAGANFWDAGLQSAGKVFEGGKSYSLSIWMKSASGPFEINIKPERAADPWEGYGESRVILTEDWVEYTTNTGVIPATVDPASITLHIAFAPGEFFLDNAVLKEDL